MGEAHQEYLLRLCRICGKFKGNRYYSVKKYEALLREFANIDVNKDIDKLHPQMLCNKCLCLLRNAKTKKAKFNLERCISWTQHTEQQCDICDMAKDHLRPGRRQKTQTSIILNPKTIDNLISKRIFPYKSFIRNTCFYRPELNPSIGKALCTICNQLLVEPLLIKKCQHQFCLKCLVPLLNATSNVSCPKCGTLMSNGSILMRPNLKSLMRTLKADCKYRCGKTFGFYEKHLMDEHEVDCKAKSTAKYLYFLNDAESSSHITESEIATAVKVIKHKMAMTNCPFRTIELETGGKPMMFVPISRPKKWPVTARTENRRIKKLMHLYNFYPLSDKATQKFISLVQKRNKRDPTKKSNASSESTIGNADPKPTSSNADPKLTSINADPKPTSSNAGPKLTSINADPKLTSINADSKQTTSSIAPVANKTAKTIALPILISLPEPQPMQVDNLDNDLGFTAL